MLSAKQSVHTSHIEFASAHAMAMLSGLFMQCQRLMTFKFFCALALCADEDEATSGSDMEVVSSTPAAAKVRENIP